MPRRSRRGMVGIDTAIILIAFVLVAAAVAFVVLDMGMTSAQKAKQTMESGLQESSTALQVDGNVMAYVNGSGYVQDIFIPLGVTPGTGYVSFAPSLMEVSIITSKGSYPDIYIGVSNVSLGAHPNVNLTAIAFNFTSAATAKYPKYQSMAAAVVYFIHGNITPYVLGPYGQALLVIHLPYGLPAYSSFTVTISPSIGGAITVARIIPPDNVSSTIIDLG
ncbi:Probable flagellin 1 precursor [Acidilobus saccharovorans 345-15]|uniref:Flagellin n=1 Tax=Acidilobus saccharovorans (strain DSM 16705 / JCM 18335 / VKM B-2471 / 345-15) TaxID=666510 RepID=D9PZ77_ACIS3|nr:archaellin/type IV pilin N-terminal domain-containing protein [Acidilobus saccharovorans]ADL19864.1 Probable flagellin 1 precursor [Acidilobus saccharovorans 345-15]